MCLNIDRQQGRVMSAETQTKTVQITINDISVQVPEGELIVEAVKRINQEIPIFCYHPRMKPVGMCRMCLVEVGFKQPDGTVRKMPKPQAACTLPASEGMAIYTDTTAIHKDRKGVLEFLLINHPLDCPVCDRGGECPLQNNTLFYGPSTSRFKEQKRLAKKFFPLSKHVTLDLERCIQCGRCVRFTEEISGDGQLAFRFRGASMQPSTFQLTDFDSKFSGNTIEICPVGALTSTLYRFHARPWDLETRKGICTGCSNGCNLWIDYRRNELMRVSGRINESLNEEWTCDKGKFGHGYYNSSERLTSPLIRKGDQFVEAGWSEAFEEIIKQFSVGGNQVAGLVKANFANEGLYLFQKLFREYFNSHNIDHRWTKNLQSYSDRIEGLVGKSNVQTSLADFESRKNILVFGCSLADEEPILYLRLRKSVQSKGSQLIMANSQNTELDELASFKLNYEPDKALKLALKLLKSALAVGNEPLSEYVKNIYSKYKSQLEVEFKKDEQNQLGKITELLRQNPSAIVTTQNLFNQENAQAIYEVLVALSEATHCEFNCYAVESTEQAAIDMGLLPDVLPGRIPLGAQQEAGLGTHGILEGCVSGQVKSLWLVNADPLSDYHDKALAQKALESVEFLVYQGVLESEAMHYANVVLPLRAPAEHDGSYTNLEGRVQRMAKVLMQKGDSKSAWRIFAEIMLRQRASTPYFNPVEVMKEIGKVVPWYADAVYENLTSEGKIVHYPGEQI
jgi:NADH-quinone oxidoreductase subunit G